MEISFFDKYRVYINYISVGIILVFIPYLSLLGLIKSSTVYTIGFVLTYAIAALGLNLLLGYSGLISLGTAGFMGISAYLASNLTYKMELPFFVSLVISVVIPVIIGLVVGLVSLRIEGYYLAIATLAIAEIFRKLFEQLTDLTGGYQGSKARFPVLFFNQVPLDKETTFVLIVIILVILMCLLHNLINSQTGRALLTMRGSNAAAQAMGINILKYRLIAFALATMLASISGVLYVHFIGLSYPTSWTLNLSLNILAIIVIGGMRSIGGTLIGAFVVYGFTDIVLKQLPIIGEIPGLPNVFTGVLIIIVILFYPQGLVKLFDDILRIAKRFLEINKSEVR